MIFDRWREKRNQKIEEKVEHIDTCWDVEPLDTAGEFPGTGDGTTERN